MLTNKLFLFLIILCGIAVSANAAYVSVLGLTKIFAGDSQNVMIIAICLETSKIVLAGALHRFWSSTLRWLKVFFVIAVVVLMAITSIGIYGFLSNAYTKAALQDQVADSNLQLNQQKLDIYQTTKQDLLQEKQSVINNISQLRDNLSAVGTVQYYSEQAGQVITSTSTTATRLYNTQLQDAINSRDIISNKITAISDSINKYQILELQIKQDNSAQSELNSLKYISKVVGRPMDQIVNWFILLIMSVFDPLAICLVIFASTITMPKRSNVVNVTESEPKPPTNQITNNNENTIPSKVSTKQPSTAKSTKVTKQVTDDTIEVQTITSDTVENSIPPKVQSSIQKAVDLYYKTRSRDKRNLPHQMRK